LAIFIIISIACFMQCDLVPYVAVVGSGDGGVAKLLIDDIFPLLLMI